jgi:Tfp pilus assembly protein PilE
MRKGFTVVELVIILVVVGLILLVGWSSYSRFTTELRCNRAGYAALSKNSFNPYCTKVVNGNTVVIHVDSLR